MADYGKIGRVRQNQNNRLIMSFFQVDLNEKRYEKKRETKRMSEK